MSYELLRSLYYGAASNADITGEDARGRLHVSTRLDELIPARVKEGLHVVITGNPGDGKSHLVQRLKDRGELRNAEVELDLSARPLKEVIERWQQAVVINRPLVLCANEGPLRELLDATQGDEVLSAHHAELAGQLHRLTVRDGDPMPPAPRCAMLVDLADRSLLDPVQVVQALERVCSFAFMPVEVPCPAEDCSSGRNLSMLIDSRDAQERLARLIAFAGRRSGEHVTFRQLWATISYAITAARKESTLKQEQYQGVGVLGTTPLDNVMKQRASGPLLEAMKRFADPSTVPCPDLDEELWSSGEPRSGRWMSEVHLAIEGTPARLWEAGERAAALKHFKRLKRLVALAHDEGERLVEQLVEGQHELKQLQNKATSLKGEVLEGLRRLYVMSSEERIAAGWLTRGVPLWVGHTYNDVPGEERPHVATASLPADAFDVRFPRRVPWLAEHLGALPDLAWLTHRPTGVSLRLDADLLLILRRASASNGPMALPERVQRFLAELAGAEERRYASPEQGEAVAFLERPRGHLIACVKVIPVDGGGARYA